MMTQQPLHELGCTQVTDYIIQVQHLLPLDHIMNGLVFHHRYH